MLLYTTFILLAVVPHQSIASAEKGCANPCSLEQQYCAGDICLDHSICTEDADCLNKSNEWIQPLCAGPITCEFSLFAKDQSGYCSKTCDEVCETNKDCGGQQYCAGSVCLDHATCRGDKDCFEPSNSWFAPECVGPITCKDGSCGKTCDTLCKNNQDCGEEQYCNGNICLDHTVCREENDCLNKLNIWPQDECVGPITCEDDSCTKSCDDGMCANNCVVWYDGCNTCKCSVDGTNEVECTEMFCANLEEAYCLEYKNESEKDCESDKDCSEKQYCSANICRDHSKCSKDVDCLNPSNEWGPEKCIGFDKCRDGVCHRTCGYHCEDQSEPMECSTLPCKESFCNGMSCVDDRCGGCNAIVFDWGGSQICIPETDKTVTLPSQPQTNGMSNSEGEDRMNSGDQPESEDQSESGADRSWNKLLVATLCLSFYYFTQIMTSY